MKSWFGTKLICYIDETLMLIKHLSLLYCATSTSYRFFEVHRLRVTYPAISLFYSLHGRLPQAITNTETTVEITHERLCYFFATTISQFSVWLSCWT